MGVPPRVPSNREIQGSGSNFSNDDDEVVSNNDNLQPSRVHQLFHGISKGASNLVKVPARIWNTLRGSGQHAQVQAAQQAVFDPILATLSKDTASLHEYVDKHASALFRADLSAFDQTGGDDYFQEIVPGVFLGARPAAAELMGPGITSNQVKHAVSLVKFIDEEAYAEGIETTFLPIEDTIVSRDTFDDTWNLLDEGADLVHAGRESGGVIVNCTRGKSRSPVLVGFYLIKHQNMTAKEAMDTMWQKRPTVEPNQDFCLMLEAAERIYINGEDYNTVKDSIGS